VSIAEKLIYSKAILAHSQLMRERERERETERERERERERGQRGSV